MYRQTRINLIIPEGADFGTNKSSLLHGVLSEMLPYEYACKIHEQSLHPYSQYILHDNDTFQWVINTFDDDLAKYIYESLEERTEIYLAHNDMTICLGEKDHRELSSDDLFIKYALNCPSKKTSITFLTPTAFKSNGQYVNMPSIQLIFQSLIKKHDSFSDNCLYSDDLMQEIIERVVISSYNLKSSTFPLEGVTIPSFKGGITLYVKGGGALPGLVRMLCEYGKYSGIGIKTALGMGAIDIRDEVK